MDKLLHLFVIVLWNYFYCTAQLFVNPNSSTTVSCISNCTIICNQENACTNTKFELLNNSNVTIKCSATLSCRAARIIASNINSLNIVFNADNSFQQGILTSNTNGYITVHCIGTYSCYRAGFQYNGPHVKHICNGTSACKQTVIHALTAVSISCDERFHVNTCWKAQFIWPVNQAQYTNSLFTLYGSPAKNIFIYTLRYDKPNISCINCALNVLQIIYGTKFDIFCSATDDLCINHTISTTNSVNDTLIINTYYPNYTFNFSDIKIDKDILLIVADWQADPAGTTTLATLTPPSTTNTTILSILCIYCSLLYIDLSTVFHAVLTPIGSYPGLTKSDVIGPKNTFIQQLYSVQGQNTYYLQNTTKIKFNGVRSDSSSENGRTNIYLGESIDVQFECGRFSGLDPDKECVNVNVFSKTNPTTIVLTDLGWNINCPSVSYCSSFSFSFPVINRTCFFPDTSCAFFTPSPTVFPSIATMNPTLFPTMNPTITPTLFPSIQTINPTLFPTILTTYPTLFPTMYPTLFPTEYPTIYVMSSAERQRVKLQLTFKPFIIGLIILILMIGIIGYIHAKCIRINDFFQLSYVIACGVQVLDTVSDFFFTIHLSTHIGQYDNDNQYSNDTDPFLIVFALSVAFLIVPIAISVGQLFHYSNKHWITDDRLSGYLSRNTKYLYVLSFLTGNAFSAISISNSNLFSLKIFCMGLSKRQLLSFSTKRVYSVVLLENVPQLIVQILYLMYSANVNISTAYIAVASLIFSFISIIVTVLSFVAQKRIINSQNCIKIKVDIVGNYDKAKCENRINKLTKYFSSDVFVDIDSNLIEILKPTKIKRGLQLVIILYFTGTREIEQYEKLMEEIKQNGELAESIRNCWKLNNMPNIKNVSVEEIQSKNMEHMMRAMSASSIDNKSQMNPVKKNTVQMNIMNQTNSL
eukprot:431035_1